MPSLRGRVSCEVDGYNAVESRTMPRARKEHRCCACRETVRRGDRYSRTFVVYEGEPETYIHCLRCSAIFDAIAARHHDAETDYWERAIAWRLDCGHDWDEVFEESPPAEVARLAFMTADEAQRELAPRIHDTERPTAGEEMQQ